jgi:hypothetical protein
VFFDLNIAKGKRSAGGKMEDTPRHRDETIENVLGGLRFEVVNGGDMDYCSATKIFGDAFTVEVDSNFDIVAGDKGRVMVGDIERSAVRHADSERLERLRRHHVFDLFGAKHSLNISFPG